MYWIRSFSDFTVGIFSRIRTIGPLFSLLNLSQNIISFERISKESCKLNVKLLLMIARNYLPFSIVENKGFKDSVHKLNPQYKIVCWKIPTQKLLPQCVAVGTMRFCKMLKEAKLLICADALRCTANHSDFGILVHFIKGDQNGINL